MKISEAQTEGYAPFSRAVPGVRKLQPYVPGKPVAELEREYGVRDAIKLASNENPLGPSPLALQAVRDALHDVARYPDGNGFTLKTCLAARLDVETNQITLGNGSNEILELVARAFVAPGDEVVISAHAFAVYLIVTQAVGGRARITAPLDWGHDLAAMGAAVNDRTRLVFVANPNNPTGTWIDATALADFIEAMPSRVLLVVDEAYFEYASAAHYDYPNSMAWLARFPNLLVTRTFSKAYGLAGLRVGYGVSHPEVAEVLNRVRQPFNLNSMALAAGEAALGDSDHLARSLEINCTGMQQLTAAFHEMGLGFIPSAGNFISVDIGRSAAPLFEALLFEGVIVRPLANYHMPQHLRITIGLPEQNDRFIAAFKKVLAL